MAQGQPAELGHGRLRGGAPGAAKETALTYRELTMMEVKEVLRRLAAGQGLRDIARQTGVDRKTVRRYADAAKGGELTLETIPDDALVHAIIADVQRRELPPLSEQRAQLMEQRARIEGWLQGSPPLKLTKVHVLLTRGGVSASYATLRRFAMDELGWGKRAPTVRVDDCGPGEEAQVDFGCMGLMQDMEAGRDRKLWVLIVTLVHSRYQFVYPTFEQTLLALCEGLDAAWRFFDGVAQRIVTDNMKAIVVKAHPTNPRLNDAFIDYAHARGFFVDLARVRRPKDKPRVENQVAYVRESWFQGEKFLTLDDARRHAAQWSRETAGGRIHGTTRKVPREVYEQVERAHMLAAPTAPFDLPLWQDAIVHEDHHIQVAHALYSLPTRYIGRKVRVRADRCLVRVFLNSELIKTHPRKAPGERSTDVNDYPPGRAQYAVRRVEDFVAKGQQQGHHVGLYIARMLDRALPWTKMRQAHQLLRLCRKYGAERVDAVCKSALDFDVIDVPRIERMLKNAHKVEQQASDSGKLRALPKGRFARSTDSFTTRGSSKKGGA
jgi:transposase